MSESDRPAARAERFLDELIQPFLVFAAVVGTAVQWPSGRILFPAVALPLFVLTAVAAIGTLVPWTRLSPRRQLTVMTVYLLCGSLLLPFAHETTTAALFPFAAAAAAGGKLASRAAAMALAVTGAVVAAGAMWVAGEPVTVSAEAAHTVVRAAQEALTNAAKYAPGASRSMRLAFTGRLITLTVCNGPATEEPRAELAGGTGTGLVGMRERAALLSGTLRAGPTDEGGWRVEVELPR